MYAGHGDADAVSNASNVCSETVQKIEKEYAALWQEVTKKYDEDRLRAYQSFIQKTKEAWTNVSVDQLNRSDSLTVGHNMLAVAWTSSQPSELQQMTR